MEIVLSHASLSNASNFEQCALSLLYFIAIALYIAIELLL